MIILKHTHINAIYPFEYFMTSVSSSSWHILYWNANHVHLRQKYVFNKLLGQVMAKLPTRIVSILIWWSENYCVFSMEKRPVFVSERSWKVATKATKSLLWLVGWKRIETIWITKPHPGECCHASHKIREGGGLVWWKKKGFEGVCRKDALTCQKERVMECWEFHLIELYDMPKGKLKG